MYKIICLIIMILVTYIPRALPLVFMKKPIKNRFINSFLYYVPYAVIACLTFPSILFFSSNIYIALIGTSCALLLSFFSKKLYITAFVSVLVVYLCSFFFY